MALVVKDRVQEITTTVGTGTITLGGAVLGFQSFATIGNGNTTYYTINDPITGDWEVGIGTYTASGTTLSRDTVLASSNAGALVPFVAGSKNVFVTYPSERAVYLDQPGSYPVQNTFNTLTAGTATLTAGTIANAPTNGTDIVNKDYADSIASGLNYHQPVNYASVAALPSYVYNNGTSGVGATITASVNGALSFGGGSPTAGQRLLVKDETGGNAPYNGVYTVISAGSAGSKFVLTRATDYDTSGTGTNEIDAGDYILVLSGTNASTAWVQQTPLPITVGTTALTFLQFNAPITYNAGTGLNLSPATTFNISNTGVTATTYGTASQVPVFAVNAQGQITSVTNTAIAIAAGAVSGLAASATTDTTNASNITSGTLPSGRLSGSYTGITGVGTLTAGTWNGGVIGPVYGGTGFGTYAVGDLLYADTTTSLAKLADVAVGNALISGGVGSAPSWGKIGLATHVSGTLPVANGGTGVTSSTGTGSVVLSTSPTLVTPLLGTPTSGNFSTGTFTWPTFNQNTTGTAAGLSATLVATSGGTGQSSYAIGDLLYASTTTALSKLADVATGNVLLSGGINTAPAWGQVGLTTHVTGILPIANGGTNSSATATNGGIGYGTGTAHAYSAAGTSGQVLQSNGAAAPTWVNLSTLGVSSFSAGTTGFTPSTATSGAVTLAGTLNVANGGTGVTTSTGSGSNVLSTSPTLVTPILGTPQSGNFSTGTFTWPTFNQNTTGNAATATSAVTLFGSTNLYISPTNGNTFNSGYGDAADGTDVWLNYRGYNDGFSYFRNFNLGNGKGTAYVYGDGVNQRVGIAKGQAASYTLDVAGIIYSNTSVRAPIFYDSNDTTYYLDPNSTSVLSSLILGSGTGVAYTNPNTAGLSFGTNTPGDYRIYTELDNYGGNFTKLTFAWHTGMRFFTYPNYGGVRFFNYTPFAGTPALSFSVNEGDGNVRVYTNIRSPIYYDQDNTGYYVDPASNSILNTATFNGTVSFNANSYSAFMLGNGSVNGSSAIGLNVYSSGGNGAIMAFHRSGYYAVNFGLDSDNVLRIGGWSAASSRWQLDMSGNNYVAGSSRAPIFYDLDDTSYYLDPNSTSDSALRIRGGALHGPNTTWGTYLLVGGDGRQNYINSSTTASVCSTNGNLHMDAASGYDMFLNYYDGSNIQIGNGANALVASIVGSDGSFRAPIFYDYNNTGYYLDPASTSNFNRLNLVGWDSSGRNYSREWIELPNYTGIYSPNNGAHFYPNNQSSYTPWIVQGSRNTWRGLHFYDGGNTPHLMFDGAANGGVYYEAGGRWASYYLYANNCWGFGTSTTSSAYNIYCPTGVYSGGRVDGTIFYDANDTSYYLDPTSTSTSLNAAGRLIVNGNMVVGKGNNAVSTNTAVGVSALASVNSNYHTAVGYNALQAHTTYVNPVFPIAGGSTAVGYGALQANVGNSTLGAGNTAIGSGAMYTSTGAYLCTVVGAYAGYNLTGGATNTIIGHRAGQVMANNSSSIIIGYNTAPNLNSNYGAGNSNTIVGNNAGAFYFGSNNTILGANTGFNMAFSVNAANSSNVLIGANTLYSQEYTTTQCTFVGYASMNTWLGDVTNSASLGYLTDVTGNNQVQLGNSSTTTYVYGTVQNRSDARDKTDIRDTQLGLGFIEALRPVDFRWDYRESYIDHIPSEDEDGNDTSTFVENPQDGSRKRNRYHHGLIAQEVKEVLDAKGIDFGGYQDHSVAGGKDVLTIGYDELVAPLIKAVQELSNQVKALSSELADLKAKS